MQVTSRVNQDNPVKSGLQSGSTPLVGNVFETMLPVSIDDVRSLLYRVWLALPYRTWGGVSLISVSTSTCDRIEHNHDQER